MAVVVLGDIQHLRFVSQEWRSATSTLVFRGRNTTSWRLLNVPPCFSPRRLGGRSSRTQVWHTYLLHTRLFYTDLLYVQARTHTHRHKTLPHTTCHTPSFTHRHSQLGHAHSFTRNLNFVAHTFFPKLERTQLFTYNFLKDRSSTTSFVFHSFLVRFNFCFCLLEEVDLWNYPVPFWHFGMHDLLRTRGPSPPTSPT